MIQMNKPVFLALALSLMVAATSCNQPEKPGSGVTAADILGNPDYPAISYGGFRAETRDSVPTVEQIMEDMKILSAMGVRILRTYNTTHFPHAERVLEAIDRLKDEDPAFEMYVMLGAWIDCEGAWTDSINHEAEDLENNSSEIEAAVRMVNAYPDIVKIIAVGNEAMVHWATSYFVRPGVILRWVRYLQELKNDGRIPPETWITSSDNFASWGGGDAVYHSKDLTALMEAVDFISMHTYPFHDSHYNPDFWRVPPEEQPLTVKAQVDSAMNRALSQAQKQYMSVVYHMLQQGVRKSVHIGETGWATTAAELMGPEGSGAADEYKQMRYYSLVREWTGSAGISCFFFEAFDEQWKDPDNPIGPENHFGLINLKGQAKMALWEMVDSGVLEGLERGGRPVTKTYGGDESELMNQVMAPPFAD